MQRMLERTVLATVLGVGLSIPVVAGAAATARLTASSRGLVWAVALLVIAAICATAWRMRRRFPASFDGSARRHPVRAGLWTVLALVALFQIARVGAFMADVSNTFGSAFPDPVLTEHMCMSAYVQAAALARDGDVNVYDEQHWPAFSLKPGVKNPGAPSSVAELGPVVQDPYEYPPPFLLLPGFGLLLTNHFWIIRAVWFAVQAVAFTAVAVALAGAIGGTEGVIAGLLVPALVGSIPALVNLQWGQAHLLTFTLSMGAFVAFRRGRAPLGGLLLGAATVFKLFPGLLLLYLALQRRYRDVAWTLAACAALTLLSLAVFGTAPFVAFFEYQLPRIGSGEAFSFFRREWFYVSRNLGVSGIVFKLGILGVPGMTASLSSAVGWLYTLVLAALVVRAARTEDRDPLGEALLWMGLLCLGSLRSPLAPSIYVAVGAIWLLMLLAARFHRPRDIALIVLAFFVIPGPPKLPSPAVDVAVVFVGQLAMLALALWAVWGRAAEPRQHA
jgi:Glycosyltransferase family 87